MAATTYDLIMLLDADAPSETRSTIVSSVEEMIGATGALTLSRDWGTRQIPFHIDHHVESAYHVFQFDAEPDSLDRLNHSLKIAEGILRFRLVKGESGVMPDAPPPPKQTIDERSTYERPPRTAAADREIEEPAPVAAESPAAPAESADEATTPDPGEAAAAANVPDEAATADPEAADTAAEPSADTA